MRSNPRHLIMDLLLAADGQQLSAREAVSACALFGISANSARVTLVRLGNEGLVEGAGRGSYRLGPNALELARDIASWRTREQRLRPWQPGQYLMVHTGALGRSDRAALRQRERALALLGFTELERELFIRPDNIEHDIHAVRDRLYKLGLPRSTCIFVAQDFDSERCAAISTLWNSKGLNDSYRLARKKLEYWLARKDELDLDVAARESFLLGGRAIHQVIFDPMLPEPFADTSERQAFIEIVKSFDSAGREIWRQMHASAGKAAAAASASNTTTANTTTANIPVSSASAH